MSVYLFCIFVGLATHPDARLQVKPWETRSDIVLREGSLNDLAFYTQKGDNGDLESG